MNAFGERIRALRLEAGLNQRELAHLIEVGFPYVSKIESGKELPSADLVRRLASTLKADEDELLLLADQIPPALAEVVKTKPTATLLLRAWHDGRLTDADIEKVLKGIR